MARRLRMRRGSLSGMRFHRLPEDGPERTRRSEPVEWGNLRRLAPVDHEWGYGRDENLSFEQLIEEQYRGIRPAAGYPACPDHTEKRILWQLLDAEKNAAIQLTESCAMWPASSVSGLYFAHAESKYFAVGKLGRDQLLDYHLRKGMTLQEAEKWLGPYLNYDPTKVAAAAPPGVCACGLPH